MANLNLINVSTDFIDELNTNAWSINRKDPNKAIEISNDALQQSKSINYKKGIADALKTLGAANVWISKNDEALTNSFEALEIYKELDDKKNQAAVNYNLGANFSYISDYDSSIKFYNRCYNISKEINDEVGMADGLNGLGTIYYRINENDKALDVLLQSQDLCLKHNCLDIYIKVLDGIGEAYYNKGENHLALDYYLKSAKISNELNNKQVEAFAIDGLGRTYAALNDPKLAEINFNRSLQLREEIGFKPGQVISLLNVGVFFIENKQYDKAIENLEKSLQLSLQINNKEGAFKACEKLGQIFEIKKDFEKAIEYYKKFSKYKDEVITEKSNQVVKSVETQNKLLHSQAEKAILEERAKELESFSDSLVLMSEVGQQIISSLSVETIVNTVYKNVNGLMDATGFGIGLFKPENNTIVFPIYIEGEETFTDIVYDITDTNRLTTVCFNNNLEIIINNFNTEISKYIKVNTQPKAGKNVESLIYLPLKFKDTLLGVITVQSFESNAYSNYHVNIFKNLATYTAIALQNARLYEDQEQVVLNRTSELIKSKEEIEKNYQINKKVSEIGREITSNLNLGKIFKKLHRSINEIMEADCFGVRIYRPELDLVEYKYEIENGVAEIDVATVPLTDDDNYTVWCIKNRKDIFLNDNVNEYQNYVKQIRVVAGEMPHSLLFTPMMLGDKLLGVLTVQSFKKFAYQPFHLDILKTLATYTATALENAYLYEYMEDKVKERTQEVVKQKEEIEKTFDNTRIVSEIGREISSTFSIQEIINKVYASVNKLMDATMFGIGIFDAHTQRINFRGVIENGKHLDDYFYTLDNIERPAVWCYTNQQDYVINSFSEEFVKSKKITDIKALQGDSTESIIYVPISINDKKIGVITVQSYLANVYNEYHLQLLKSLAVYTAIAIDNASLYTNMEVRVKERTREIEIAYDNTRLLSKIAEDISASLSVETINAKVYQNINKLMKTDAFGIGIFNQKNNCIEFKGYIENGETLEPIYYDVADKNKLSCYCFNNKTEIFINDYFTEYSKYVDKSIKPIVGVHAASIICLPIFSKENCTGVLTIQSFEKNIYSEYQLNLLRNMAVSIGIAIDNAYLYQNLEEKVNERTLEVVKQKEEIEKSYENTRLLSEIGKEITSTFSINEIISKVYNSVNKIMDATMFGIGIYDKETNKIVFTGAIENGEILDEYFYDISDVNRPASKCYSTQTDHVILNFTEEYVKKANLSRHSLPGQNTESIIYVPVTTNDKKIGVITVQSFKVNAYTDYHLQVLKSLAVYAAIALDNASLYNNLDNRVKERTEEIRVAYENTRLLSQIAEDISSSLSVEVINTKVYQNINKLMKADCFGIGIFNPQNNLLEFKGFIENNSVLDLVSFNISDANRLATQSYINKSEIFIHDYFIEYSKYIKGIKTPVAGNDSASIFYLPLYSKENCIGVITVQSYEKNVYTDYHLNLLRNMAVSIGIALDNASLYQNLEEKVNERTLEVVKQKEQIEKTFENTRLISEIGKEISTTFSINDIISKVYQSVNRLMDATVFGIGIFDEKTRNIVFEGVIERNEVLDRYSYSIDEKDRPAVWCYLNQKDYVINNYTKENQQHNLTAVQGEMPEGIIYVPLTQGNKKIGVITVQSFVANSYTDYHLQLLKSLAIYAAIAIDNASLYNNMEERVKERTLEIEKNYEDTRLLSQIAEDISSSLSVETINSKVYKNINQLMDATMFGIGIYNPANKHLEFKGFMENNQLMEDFSYRADDPNRLAAHCFTNNKEIFINDYSVEYTKYIKGIQAPISGQDSASILYLPLYSKDNIIGVITVQSFEKNAYSDYNFNILKNLAVSVGIALDNANLYQNLEEKVKERTQEIEFQAEIIAEANKELELLSIVASRTDNVVLVLKPNGDIEYVNEAFQKLNNITLQEMLDNGDNIFTSSNNPKIKEIVEEAVTNKRSVKYESYNNKNPDNKIWESSTLTPIFDESGEVKKIIIIDSDITESKKQQVIIEEKNKDITDSIRYAKKIQQAVAPNIDEFNKNFTESFILYKPKDIVSGDFYWFEHYRNGVTVFAAADCTGHGVPGAFMSLICSDIMYKVINDGKVNNPSEALHLIDEKLVQLIKKSSESSANDGMDIALCSYYKKQNKLEFAGAQRPMLLIRNGEMIDYKPSKYSIGGHTAEGKEFELNSIDVQKGDLIYLLTDGYADQFGGDKGKKFKFKNLKELILSNHTKPMQEQKLILDTAFESWKGALEQVDDVCIIGVKI
ncbi:MAG: GAF domain-containing protein [Bacteroidota bacterium]|nr:GAF domain-containing protein [Bacteroidota bacterium]